MGFKQMGELICEKTGKEKECLFFPQWDFLVTSECDIFLQ